MRQTFVRRPRKSTSAPVWNQRPQNYSVKDFEETIALQVIQIAIGASFERW